MDFIPIIILSLALAIYFWYRFYSNWVFVVVMGIVIIGARMIPSFFFPGQDSITASYFFGGLLIVIPLVLTIIKVKKSYNLLIFLSAISFSLGLFFRYADKFEIEILLMGTHFLWHIFTGIGAYLLGKYIFVINNK